MYMKEWKYVGVGKEKLGEEEEGEYEAVVGMGRR